MEKIRVMNPKRFPAEIPCRRIADFGLTGMKPNIVRLENGELLLVNFHAHYETQKDGCINEHTMLYRSSDNGLSWSSSHYDFLLGREPYFSRFKDDILIMTTHALSLDVKNKLKRGFSVLHRSEDRGHTWESSNIDMRELWGNERTSTTRNILELDDGKYIMGVGCGYGEEYLFVSSDKGKTWDIKKASVKGIKTDKGEYYIFEEGLFFRTDTGRIMMLARNNLSLMEIQTDIPGIPDFDYKTTGTHDHFDIEILYESKDCGLTWEPVGALNIVSCMYPSVCSLGGGKYLVTVTIRTPFGGNNMGVQALIMEEKPGGQIVFHDNEDRLVIDEKTPSYLQSGGGFGNTIILPDGTCLTPYSYYRADDEIVELMTSGRFIERDVFEEKRQKALNYYHDWAAGFTWEQVVKGPEDLQRHCFLGCCDTMNLCGMRTELAIWKLPSVKEG
jgi:hypothetical protein